jgi:hypothetical protein
MDEGEGDEGWVVCFAEDEGKGWEEWRGAEGVFGVRCEVAGKREKGGGERGGWESGLMVGPVACDGGCVALSSSFMTEMLTKSAAPGYRHHSRVSAVRKGLRNRPRCSSESQAQKRRPIHDGAAVE